MKPVLYLAVLFSWLAGTPSWGQYHSLRLRGWGGLGGGYSSVGQSGADRISNSDSFKDFSLEADGFLYNPQLATYTFGAGWTDSNTKDENTSFRSMGWTYNGGLGLLSGRSFPFGIRLFRTITSSDSSLLSNATSDATGWAVNGNVFKNPVAPLAYGFGQSSSSAELQDVTLEKSWTRFANFSANRALGGWQLGFRDDYNKRWSTLTDFAFSNNYMVLDGRKAFGKNINLSLVGTHMSTSALDRRSGQSDDGSSTSVGASLGWRLTSKLQTYYSGSLARSAINTLQVVTESAGSSIPLPFSPRSINDTYYSVGAGLAYAATSSLTLGVDGGHSGNTIPDQETIASQTRDMVTTGTDYVSGSARFNRKLWKLDYFASGNVGSQMVHVLTGRTDNAMTYSALTGFTGGDARTLAYSVSAQYAHQSTPIFFNRTMSTGTGLHGQLSSNRFRLVTLQASGNFSANSLDMTESRSSGQSKGFGVNAGFPKQRASVFYSYGASDSNSHWLTISSVLFQPGGSTGGVALPDELFAMPLFSASRMQQAGANWAPRGNLQIQSRWVNNYYQMIQATSTWVRDSHLDLVVQYKFGRFTMFGVWSHSNATSGPYDSVGDRMRFQVRFPFHLLG